MEYPKVVRAHIVPRFWLRRFSTADRVTVRFVETGDERTISIDNAAIRKRFYRRFRPDGAPIDDVEWSLSQVESGVAPMLRSVETDWPPGRTEKLGLAELFAFQAVRGPRWKEWREARLDKSMEESRADPTHQLESGLWVPVRPETLDSVEEHLRSETEWLKRMMRFANKLITVFGSMKWDLLKFDGPLLAISDHPVVEWPIATTYRRAGVATDHGAVNLFEVRVPLASDAALLMSWRRGPDAGGAVRGTEDQAANLNAFTIAHAEQQWMHKPDHPPPVADALMPPLLPDLHPTYGHPDADRSPTRTAVAELLNASMGEELEVDDEGHPIAPIVKVEGD